MDVKAYFKEVKAHFNIDAEKIVISGKEEEDFDHYVFVIVEDELSGKERFNLQINCEYHCDMFRGVTIWNGFVVIGFDTQCYLFNMETKKIIRHKLNSYFDSFYIGSDNIYICSASHINCFSREGDFVWCSDKLGVDSVKIYRIEDGIIYGTSDWGGDVRWKDFELNVSEKRAKAQSKMKRLLSLLGI